MAELRQEARPIVDENWRQTRAVATALMLYQRLTPDQWPLIVDAVDEAEAWGKALAGWRRLFGVA